MSREVDVAVVGATGAVGEAMLSILAERDFPVGRVYPLASSRSAGKRVEFRGRHLRVENLEDVLWAVQVLEVMPPEVRELQVSVSISGK